MVQRDYAAVSEILDSAQKLQGMTYLSCTTRTCSG